MPPSSPQPRRPGPLPLSPAPKPLEMSKTTRKGSIYTKHPEFYFSDGSIVLRIEETSFRVHQSILARHSDVFGDMWDVPQPQGIELVDGCPVVDLQDDLQDFTDTLRAIYDSFHFDNLDTAKAPLGVLLTFISGILRVSTKYNMTQLRKKCIAILQRRFPNTLDACSLLLQTQLKYEPADIVRLIPLARATNVPEALPWAYYLCTHMSVNDIIASPVLSWEDKALCLAGKERLWQAQKDKSHSVLFTFTPSPQCATTCQTKMLSSMPGSMLSSSTSSGSSSSSASASSSSASLWMGMSWREAEVLRQNPHPLQEFDDWQTLKQQICSKCLAHQMSLHKKGRQQVWDLLPTFFELGTWEDIRQDQGA